MGLNAFLNLPTELRLQIYGFVVPDVPLSSPSSQFSGLLYSCTAIRNELEPEICKSMNAFVNTLADCIRSKGDDIIFTPPTTLRGWLNLTVSRPIVRKMFEEDDPFHAFKYFYFDTLTVVFHKQVHAEWYEYCPATPQMYQYAAKNLAKEIAKHSTDYFPAMKIWVLDWSAHPQIDARKFMGGALLCQKQPDAWDMLEFKNKEGLFTGVAFYRMPDLTTESYRVATRRARIPVVFTQIRGLERSDINALICPAT